MKKHNYWRFILRNSVLPGQLSPGQEYSLDEGETTILHQLTRVFRAQAGDNVVLMDKNEERQENIEADFQVVEVGKKVVKLRLEKTRILQDPLKSDLILALAIPNKPAKLEMILQHCTELGVNHFKLITTDYSNYHHQLRTDRLESILLEAVEQSERARVPQISTYESLDSYLSNLKNKCYVALERLSQPPDKLSEAEVSGKLDILIGPEGGFSDRETGLLKSFADIQKYSLGKQILRNETAAIVSCGLFGLRVQN